MQLDEVFGGWFLMSTAACFALIYFIKEKEIENTKIEKGEFAQFILFAKYGLYSAGVGIVISIIVVVLATIGEFFEGNGKVLGYFAKNNIFLLFVLLFGFYCLFAGAIANAYSFYSISEKIEKLELVNSGGFHRGWASYLAFPIFALITVNYPNSQTSNTINIVLSIAGIILAVVASSQVKEANGSLEEVQRRQEEEEAKRIRQEEIQRQQLIEQRRREKLAEEQRQEELEMQKQNEVVLYNQAVEERKEEIAFVQQKIEEVRSKNISLKQEVSELGSVDIYLSHKNTEAKYSIPL